MKIEIEFEEVELLKMQLVQKQHLINQLESKLKELSEKELVEKAVRLSYRLLDNYLLAIFNRLGFEQTHQKAVVIHYDLEHWIGKDWWNSDRFTIELGADVSTKFKSAFLSIGVLTKDEASDDDVHKLA